MVISINKKQREALMVDKKVRLQLNKIGTDTKLEPGAKITARVMARRGGNDISCVVAGVQNYSFSIKKQEIE